MIRDRRVEQLLIELEMKLRETRPEDATYLWLRQRAADVWEIRTMLEPRFAPVRTG